MVASMPVDPIASVELEGNRQPRSVVRHAEALQVHPVFVTELLEGGDVEGQAFVMLRSVPQGVLAVVARDVLAACDRDRVVGDSQELFRVSRRNSFSKHVILKPSSRKRGLIP